MATKRKTLSVRFTWDARPWWRPLLPSFERWDCRAGVMWHFEWLGVSLFRDTAPEMTVGERGVW